MAVAAMAMLSGALLYWMVADHDIWLAWLCAIDRRAMLLLNFDGGAVADHFFYGYSQKTTWLPLAVVTIAYTFGWRRGTWRESLALALIIVAMFAFTDQITSGVIKPLVARPRPSHDAVLAPMLHYVYGYHGGHFGFVSGHAANMCCLAVFLGYVYRSKAMRAVLCLFAALMCYSRIYLGVHYPGDIVCGALVGMGVARLVVAVCPARLLPRYERTPWGVIVVWTITTLLLLA